MNKNKKVKPFKEELVKEERERIPEEESLTPYTTILKNKNKFHVKFKTSRIHINYKDLKTICELSGLKKEGSLIYSFYQGNINEDGISITSRDHNQVLQIPQNSKSIQTKTPTNSDNSIIRIPRKFNQDILKETTQHNYIGNFIDVFTRVWYCIYPIYIIIACFHLIHLVVYYVRLWKVCIYYSLLILDINPSL